MTRLDLLRAAPLMVLAVVITAADLVYYRGRNPLERGYTLAEFANGPIECHPKSIGRLGSTSVASCVLSRGSSISLHRLSLST